MSDHGPVRLAPPQCSNCGDPFDGPERDCPNPSPGRPYVDCGRGGHMFDAGGVVWPDPALRGNGGFEHPTEAEREQGIDSLRKALSISDERVREQAGEIAHLRGQIAAAAAEIEVQRKRLDTATARENADAAERREQAGEIERLRAALVALAEKWKGKATDAAKWKDDLAEGMRACWLVCIDELRAAATPQQTTEGKPHAG